MQTRYIVLAVLFFSIGQSMAWMQMNAPILWSSFNRYKWILIYKKAFKNKSDAMSFEYKLKRNRKERKIILKKYNK